MNIEEETEYLRNYKYDNEVKEAIETVLAELENKQDDINILQVQRDSMEYQFKQAKLELDKKEAVINEMAECIGQDIRCVRPEIECNKMTHDCRECVKQYYFNKVEREGK